MHGDLLDVDLEAGGDRRPRVLRRLGGGPDLDETVLHLRDGDHRFHLGVREVRQVVLRRDPCATPRRAPRRRRPACGPACPPRAPRPRASSCSSSSRRSAFGPGFQVIASALQPWMAAQVLRGDDRHAAQRQVAARDRRLREAHDALDARHLAAPRASSTVATVPPQTGGRAMTAVFMPGSTTSAPKTRRAGGHRHEVDRRHLLPLPAPLGDALDAQPLLRRHGEGARRGHQRGERQRAPGGGVHHRVLLRLHLAGGDAPLLRRRVLEQGAHRRPRLAVPRQEVADARRAVGVLRAVLLVVAVGLHDPAPAPSRPPSRRR